MRQSILWYVCHVLATLTGIDFNDLRIENQNRTLLDSSYLFDKYKRGTTLESISKLVSGKRLTFASHNMRYQLMSELDIRKVLEC